MKRTPNPFWNQQNNGDVPIATSNGVLNNMVGSMSLELTKRLGKTRINSMSTTTKEENVSQLSNYPIGFKYFSNAIYTACGSGSGHALKNNGTVNGAFSDIPVTTTEPSTIDSRYSDIEVGNNGQTLYITSGTSNTIYYTNDGTTWLQATVGSFADPRILCDFAGRTYVAHAKNQVGSWSTSPTSTATSGAYTIAIAATLFQITFMRATSQYIYIGAMNLKNGKGRIYQWDGVSNQANRYYQIDAVAPISCAIKDDIPYVMDSNGRLLMWNGGYFKEVAKLPVEEKYLVNATSTTNNRFVHSNGMIVREGKVNILVNTTLNNTNLTSPEFCPSGVWEYDDNIGLYHKYPLANSADQSSATDYGQHRVSSVGGMAYIKRDTTNSTDNGDMLAGAVLYTDASTTKTRVLCNDTNAPTKQKGAYVVTAELPAEGIMDNWSTVWLSFRRLLNSGDKIVVKYRYDKQAASADFTVTYTSATQFTTTSSTIASYAVGDEVEFMQGGNSGLCAHITAISSNGGTYTVTIDETLVTTSGTGKARLQKWSKAGSFTRDSSTQHTGFSTKGAVSPWMQYKIFFLWKGDNEFECMYPMSRPAQRPL